MPARKFKIPNTREHVIFQRLTFGSAAEKFLREGMQGEGKDTTLRASKVLVAELLSLGVKSFDSLSA